MFIALLFVLPLLAEGSFMSSFKALESEVVQRVTGFNSECTFTRHGAVDCIARYIDTNHDDVVTVAEIDAARDRYTGFILRILQKAVSWEIDMSTEKVVKDCGGDKDGRFTEENFLHGPASKTCMADQVSMCMFEAACKHAANVYEDEKRAASTPRKSTWWNRIKTRL